MASRRRSTRLSSVHTDTKTSATPKRRSEIWQLRKPNYCDDDTEENEDDLDVLQRVDVLKERNENQRKNSTRLSMKSHKKGNSPISAEASIAENAMKTPRSSKQRQKFLNKEDDIPIMSNKRKTNEITQNFDVSDGNPSGVSPPKVTRHNQKAMAHHLISPSRLIDRLSIDERKETSSSELSSSDEEARTTNKNKNEKQKSPKSSPRNKYQNARRVLNSSETQNLPGREEQLQELREFFTSHLREQSSSSLYVSGQPGTGKTACLSLLLRSPEISKQLQCAYINCTSIASVGSVYKKLCTELKLNVHGRTERDSLEAIKHHLCKDSKRMTLIVLDEIDQLCTSRQSVLYTIFEWPSLPDARLLLVGIANSLDLTDRALIRLNARCELKPQLLHFPPYTKQQIVEIFRSRLEEAGVLEVFPPVTLQLLAAKVSAVSGDVRRALDIGRRVVEIAEQQKKAGKRIINLNDLKLDDEQQPEKDDDDDDALKPVQVSQVAEVLNKVYGASQRLDEDIEESFPLQQKLMLCTLMLMLRNEKNKDLSIGRLHEVYRRVCNKRNICALDQAEFAGLVDLVETRGILRIVRKKEPRLSKVQLQWDEDEVNAALSDKQLIATILNDKACLRSGA